MSKTKHIWLVVAALLLAAVLAACSSAPQTAEQAKEKVEEGAADVQDAVEAGAAEAEAAVEEAEEAVTSTGGGCPTATVADAQGVPAGKFPQQYDLAEFQELAGCELSFAENPDIKDLNVRIAGNPDLPAVGDRLPAEPLVVAPYQEIGLYGGVLDGLSNATESGTSDLLSIRHVNFARYADDLQTIVPNIAKGWAWNDDFTELTIYLRQGHKWSDGAPFTAEDVEFWYNELILNSDVYEEVPSLWLVSGEPMEVTAVDETTVSFKLPVPAPNLLTLFAVTYAQPFQPKHFFERQIEETGKSLKEVADLYYRGSDWKDVPSPLLAGESDVVAPTLESHILAEETTEGRRLVANPYFHMVDTAGNQLPYINEQDELYVPDAEVRNLKITNGEVSYKTQSIDIIDYPLYKENEAKGNYTADLGFGVGETIFYGFNLTHPDGSLREIFTDLRFRQAMSLAINRPEIVELVYLGQAEPIQATPADPNTVDFVTDEQKTAFIQYDPAKANALLDEMGLVDADGDGLRDRLDGSPLTLDLQFSTQGGPAALQELVKGYWEAVGISTRVKEVTSDEYRDRANSNQADVLTWKFDGTAGSVIVLNTEMLLPPFGEPFNPGIAYGWQEWVNSGGKSGVEPPADAIKLYDIVGQFLQHPLGTPESNALGQEMVDIHVNNLWKIGIAGNVKQPIIHHNTLKNFGPFTVVSYDYYRTYPMLTPQWYFAE